MSKVIVDNQTVVGAFQAHLVHPIGNKRILFSGPFGSGKSFFLKEFFEKHPSYLKISLFPVDYPIANNEDILENIKYDILNVLLDDFSEDLDLSREDFSTVLLIQSYLMHKLNYFSLGKKILKTVLPGSDVAVETIEAAKGVLGQFSAYSQQLSETEKDKVAEYFAAAKSKKGSIREQDEITEMVRGFLIRLKSKYKGSSSILVIDDLDRLDPDHVFRLFNIFTAHYDSQEEINKFGFDQVVLVCDVDTLRHMFHHRYGVHANFNGYIDKFYSTTPFVFNNKKFLIERIDALLTPKMKLSENGSNDRVSVNNVRRYGAGSDFYGAFKELLARMIDLNLIKIRNFDRYSHYVLPGTTFELQGRQTYQTDPYQFLVLVDFLRQFFVGFHELKAALMVLSDNFIADYNEDLKGFLKDEGFDDFLISISLPFIIDERIIFKRRRSDGIYEFSTFSNEFSQQIFINYKIDESNDYWNGGVMYLGCKLSPSSENNLQRPNPFWFLIKALDYCERKGIIR